MPIDIHFYRKCFVCDFESRILEKIYWTKEPYPIDDLIPNLSQKDLANLLDEIHDIENITCTSCGSNDHFGYNVMYLNGHCYNGYTPERESNYGIDGFIPFRHEKLKEMSREGLLSIKLKSGVIKTVEVIDSMIGSGGLKYSCKVFFLQNDGVSYETINAEEITGIKCYEADSSQQNNDINLIDIFANRLATEFRDADLYNDGQFHNLKYRGELNSIEVLISEENPIRANSNLFVLKIFMTMVHDESGLNQLAGLQISELVLKIIDGNAQFHTYRVSSSKFHELFNKGLKLGKTWMKA
jgi:hypothetical protein